MGTRFTLVFLQAVFFIYITAETYRNYRSACRRDTLFKASDIEKKLVGDALLSLHVTRFALCARKCSMLPTCRSFNYKKKTSSSVDLNCELLSNSKQDSNGATTAAAGWSHYEPVAQIGPRCRLTTCNPGYECKESCTTQSGYQCIDINECASNPCLNGGTCADGTNKYSCSCVAGYTGNTCGTNVNECASNPCQNGGTCTDGLSQYTCACASGFSGTQCQNTQQGGGWLYGDGIGGSEMNIGSYASKEACLQQCSKTTSNGVYANGATATTGSPVTCFCEFGMTARSTGTSYLSAFVSPSCTSYLSLTDPSRNVNAKTGTYCDSSFSSSSYRFSGAAGSMMPTSCVTPYYCSTHGAGWIQGTHPSQAEGVVDRKVCFSWSGNCCYHSRQIKVRNCGSFYVYELPSTGSCSWRYCGTN